MQALGACDEDVEKLVKDEELCSEVKKDVANQAVHLIDTIIDTIKKVKEDEDVSEINNADSIELAKNQVAMRQQQKRLKVSSSKSVGSNASSTSTVLLAANCKYGHCLIDGCACKGRRMRITDLKKCKDRQDGVKPKSRLEMPLKAVYCGYNKPGGDCKHCDDQGK